MATVAELAQQLNEYMNRNEQYIATEFRGAAAELDILRQRFTALEGGSRDIIGDVRSRVSKLEDSIRDRGHGQGDNGGKGRNLTHPKMISPTVAMCRRGLTTGITRTKSLTPMPWTPHKISSVRGKISPERRQAEIRSQTIQIPIR